MLLLLLLLLSDTKNEREDSHACEHPIFHLPEVSGARVGVNISRDLVHSGQWMQHSHFRLGLDGKGGGGKDVYSPTYR